MRSKNRHQWQFCGIIKCKMTDWNSRQTSRKLERAYQWKRERKKTKSQKWSSVRRGECFYVERDFCPRCCGNKFMMHVENVEKVQVHFWCKQFIHFQCTSTIIRLVSRKSYGHYVARILCLVRQSEMLLCIKHWNAAEHRYRVWYVPFLHRNTLVTLNQFHGAVARVQCRRYYNTHSSSFSVRSLLVLFCKSLRSHLLKIHKLKYGKMIFFRRVNLSWVNNTFVLCFHNERKKLMEREKKRLSVCWYSRVHINFIWHTHMQRFTKYKNDNARTNYNFIFANNFFLFSFLSFEWENILVYENKNILSIKWIEFQTRCALHSWWLWVWMEFVLASFIWIGTQFFCFLFLLSFSLYFNLRNVNIIVIYIFCCLTFTRRI